MLPFSVTLELQSRPLYRVGERTTTLDIGSTFDLHIVTAKHGHNGWSVLRGNAAYDFQLLARRLKGSGRNT